MSLLDRYSLGEGFRNYFEIAPAFSDDLRRQAYGIRHEVYCEELGFEPAQADRLETDPADRHSLPYLLRTVGTASQLVGCGRLVLAQPENPSHPLPFEQVCQATLNRQQIDPARLPRERVAEVSRVAVRGQYRHRRGEPGQALALTERDFSTDRQPRFPYIPISLYLTSVAMARREGIETLFMLTEPRLAEHFGRLGVRIVRIGGGVEHRGLRVPSMMDVDDVIRHLRGVLQPIWQAVTERVDAAYADPGRPRFEPAPRSATGLGPVPEPEPEAA